MSDRYDITPEVLRSGDPPYRVLHAGDDYNHKFTVDRPPGTPMNLTGAKIWFTIKESRAEPDSQARLQLTSAGAGVVVTSPDEGKFEVRFASGDTDDLAGLWEYDIQVKMGDDTVVTIATGQIEFLPNLTRAIA